MPWFGISARHLKRVFVDLFVYFTRLLAKVVRWTPFYISKEGNVPLINFRSSNSVAGSREIITP